MPAKVLVGGVLKEVQYKMFEYSVTYANGTSVERTSDTDYSNTLGNMTTTCTTTAGTNPASFVTAVANSVEMRPLIIHKVWDDNNNAKSLRNTTLNFTLVRDGDAKQTVTVSLSSANAVSGNTNEWETMVYVPVYKNNSSTEKSAYTVTEATVLDNQYGTKVSLNKGATWAAGTSVSLSDPLDNTNAWFMNKLMTTGFSMKKIDKSSGAAIPGTVFNLAYTPADKTTATTTEITSDANGIVAASNLAKGTYVLTEKTANANYNAVNFSASFTVNNDCQDQTLNIVPANVNAGPFHLTITDLTNALLAGGLQNERKTRICNNSKEQYLWYWIDWCQV
jgi:hypothetical protein